MTKIVMQVFVVMVLSMAATLANANDLLKDVTFEDKGEEIEIRAELTIPFSYVKHFPSKRGKIIQLQLKVDTTKVDKKKIKRRETIKPSDAGALQIRDVIFEGNVRGGPYLVLRFFNVISFTVEKVKNKKSILIRVKKEKAAKATPVAKPKVSQEDKKLMEVDQLMRDARFALTNGKNSEAILLFTKLLSMHEHKHVADAKEYLGLARERNGQLEMAKKEYEEYLKIHPKNPRANTVKQRLMTLNARLAAPKKQLKESKRTLAKRSSGGLRRSDMFGRFSQIYYSAYNAKEGASITNQQSMLLSFFDANWRKRDAEKETRMVFSGSHEEDLNRPGRDDPTKDDRESRIRSLYADYKGKKGKYNGLHVSVGRQSVNSGGVLGRFDGGVLGFRIKPKYHGYLVGGFPVDFLDNLRLQTNKPMAGFRLDVDDVIPHWKGSTYFIHQLVDGITNRSAVGADARYFHNKKIFYALIDYDISYQTTNFLTAHYGWQLNKKTKIDLHFDKRRSPVMLTSNALQGLSGITADFYDKDGDGVADTPIPDTWPVSDLGSSVFNDELDEIKQRASIQALRDAGMTEKEIRDRAKKNTGHSTLITASIRRNLKKDLELNSSITLNKYRPGKNLEEEKDEDEPPEDTSFVPSLSDWDVFVYGQLIQRNFFKTRDILIGGLRFSDNDSSTRYEANASIRYPFKKKWWFTMKMRVMYTTKKATEQNPAQDAARANPKLRVEFRYNKKLTLEGEIGTEINKSEIQGEDYTYTSGNLGFRYLF